MCVRGLRFLNQLEPRALSAASFARTAGFLSPAGRVLEADRRPDGSRVVRRFALQEISAVRVPLNPEARILERRESDPVHELRKVSDRQHDLLRAGFEAAARGLQTLGRLRAG